MNSKRFGFIRLEKRDNKKILLFKHPDVIDSDPGEKGLKTHGDWQPTQEIAGKNIAGVLYRVTDQAVEIDVTHILPVPKGKKMTAGIALTSRDGKTTVTLPFELIGANNKASITSSPIDVNESQRGVIDITDQVKVSDPDPGEARLQSKASQSLKLFRSDNTEVDGAFFYAISSDGKLIVDASQLPQMREGEVFSATINVASQDSTANKALQLRFHGENGPDKVGPTDPCSDHEPPPTEQRLNRRDIEVRVGRWGNLHFHGTSEGDVIYGDANSNFIFSGAGNDRIFGGDGNDWIYGLTGNNALYGEGGDDYIVGGDGHDLLCGGEGNDVLHGGAGNDRLLGGEGNDELKGGDGNDVLVGGAGNNVLNGGVGRDVFVWSEVTLDKQVDRVIGFELGQDRLDLTQIYQKYGKNVRLKFSALENSPDNGTMISIDVNTEGAPQLRIIVEGLTMPARALSDQQILSDYLRSGILIGGSPA